MLTVNHRLAFQLSRLCNLYYRSRCVSTTAAMSASNKSATGDTAITLRHLNYRKKLAHNGGAIEAPGFAELIVIGSGGRGTPKSLLLNTDHIKLVL